MCRSGKTELPVDGDQGVGEISLLCKQDQVTELLLRLRICEIDVLDSNGLAKPHLQVVAGNMRGLLRRPGGASAAGAAELLVAVAKHGNRHT